MEENGLNFLANRPIAISRAPRLAAVGLIAVYRLLVSPVLGPCCRYGPSCSEYAMLAVERFGIWHGGWLALRRIARCHPFAASGYDPVPDAPGAGRAESQRTIRN